MVGESAISADSNPSWQFRYAVTQYSNVQDRLKADASLPDGEPVGCNFANSFLLWPDKPGTATLWCLSDIVSALLGSHHCAESFCACSRSHLSSARLIASTVRTPGFFVRPSRIETIAVRATPEFRERVATGTLSFAILLLSGVTNSALNVIAPSRLMSASGVHICAWCQWLNTIKISILAKGEGFERLHVARFCKRGHCETCPVRCHFYCHSCVAHLLCPLDWLGLFVFNELLKSFSDLSLLDLPQRFNERAGEAGGINHVVEFFSPGPLALSA